ncbi:pilus assembly protein N-terminal domain-containing protein [Hoeflea sp. G2-23]|uniref:Pilus assembly protein N-terminal domain-containing protein n=1 Tax=Hoeflea algicola TaxID=2983763 RepID=A0ABT3ZBM7_9HYPH|nr:pilus assembly protein N-terminal domain-containing protein [Hoeflea algicola]MCY0149195.1 pilus assembly protein N-terminal domain-containing protein [Hoeflea algicola]
MTYPIPVHRRLLFAACSLALTAATTLPAGAAEDMIRVFMDHARILKLDRTVSKVIIGNAGVADVTIADPQTIVLTGKSYGTTNLVILDQAGDAIVDERILVSVDEANTVRVFKQTARSVYSCSPSCEEHVPTASKTP